MPPAALATAQEATSRRLLASTARVSFDPETEIDWDQPLDPHLPCMPWEAVSLYGTQLWGRMSEQQRLDLARHEVASLAGTGIWLETVLMRMLLRHINSLDPRSAHVRYAFTEIADECRHSIMFARLITALDCPVYRPSRLAHALSSMLATTANGVEIFAGALIGEEILDQLQRDAIIDNNVQPLVRAVDRIHIIEEARHISYARDELTRQWEAMRAPRRTVTRISVAQTVHVVTRAFVHPDVYTAVGLNPRDARRQATHSSHRRQTLTHAARNLTGRLYDIGLIDRTTRRTWSRAGLLDD